MEELGGQAKLGVRSVSMPYDEEPIADEEWVKKYHQKEEKKSTLRQALQDWLDNKIPMEDWWVCVVSVCLHQHVYGKPFVYVL